MEIGTSLVKAKDGDNLVDQELCQSAIGSLLYLSTKRRPDIAYAVGNVAHFSSKPTQTTVCSCHVTYVFQSESTLYICLNVKELFARNRHESEV